MAEASHRVLAFSGQSQPDAHQGRRFLPARGPDLGRALSGLRPRMPRYAGFSENGPALGGAALFSRHDSVNARLQVYGGGQARRYPPELQEGRGPPSNAVI